MNQYQNIFHNIQKILLEKTINIFPDFRGRLLNNTVREIVKLVRLERARAKKELIERAQEELDYFYVETEGKKLVDIEDIKFVLNNLQRETFLFQKENPKGKI